MINVEEAKNLVKNNVGSLPIIEINVEDALGFYLAESIVAPISVPSFNQSAMDGYAFRFDELNQSLKIENEIPAGDITNIDVQKGEAVRIFTGSKVPLDCDTVVMQELTEVENGQLKVKDSGLKKGGNIRFKGSQITKGDLALEKGVQVTPATIGFLSALGLTKIKVYNKPKVAIIATGNELVKPGQALQEGQIYESNTFMLKAVLSQKGINATVAIVEDTKEATEQAIKIALSENDLLILSGGISVGDYDFVKAALESNNVQEIFYKVKQKPGKPLYFAKTNSCSVFALPGNPAAALTCFYQYVNEAINQMMGEVNTFKPAIKLPLTAAINKKEGRAVFYKAITDLHSVEVLEGQGSDVLKSFAESNCFVYLPAEKSLVEKNEKVDVYLF